MMTCCIWKLYKKIKLLKWFPDCFQIFCFPKNYKFLQKQPMVLFWCFTSKLASFIFVFVIIIRFLLSLLRRWYSGKFCLKVFKASFSLDLALYGEVLESFFHFKLKVIQTYSSLQRTNSFFVASISSLQSAWRCYNFNISTNVLWVLWIFNFFHSAITLYLYSFLSCLSLVGVGLMGI